MEAQTALAMGPPPDLWNFIRRPLPTASLTVVEPWEARLSMAERSVVVVRGGQATLELRAERLSADAEVQGRDLPGGIDSRASRVGGA